VLSPINEIGVFSFKVGLQPNRRKDEKTRVKKLSTLKDTNYNWSNVQLLQHLLRCKIAKTLVFLPSLIPAVGQSKVDKHLAALMRLILKLILFPLCSTRDKCFTAIAFFFRAATTTDTFNDSPADFARHAEPAINELQ
jgi:hypothetical protein